MITRTTWLVGRAGALLARALSAGALVVPPLAAQAPPAIEQLQSVQSLIGNNTPAWSADGTTLMPAQIPNDVRAMLAPYARVVWGR